MHGKSGWRISLADARAEERADCLGAMAEARKENTLFSSASWAL